jgi:hypothetical protein
VLFSVCIKLEKIGIFEVRRKFSLVVTRLTLLDLIWSFIWIGHEVCFILRLNFLLPWLRIILAILLWALSIKLVISWVICGYLIRVKLMLNSRSLNLIHLRIYTLVLSILSTSVFFNFRWKPLALAFEPRFLLQRVLLKILLEHHVVSVCEPSGISEIMECSSSPLVERPHASSSAKRIIILFFNRLVISVKSRASSVVCSSCSLIHSSFHIHGITPSIHAIRISSLIPLLSVV